jgi:pimeloyl-ACP methyl ester carboxylesterase
MLPETRYARSGDVNIAYQVLGNGPADLILVPGWVSNLDVFWEEPALARFFTRLASFSRLILFDKRGTGLSDRVADMPSLEVRMDDVRAVMDRVGSERTALFGYSEGGSMCALFAATYPRRTSALIMNAAFARRTWAPDYPWGRTQAQAEAQRSRDRQCRGWLSGHLRWAGPRRSLRLRDLGRSAAAGHRGAGRPAHRRVRNDG